MTIMTQIQCSKNNVNRICWTDISDQVAPGWKIKFKGEDSFWRIDKIWTKMEKGAIPRCWHVGGL